LVGPDGVREYDSGVFAPFGNDGADAVKELRMEGLMFRG
jgi:hypothetical protein